MLPLCKAENTSQAWFDLRVQLSKNEMRKTY